MRSELAFKRQLFQQLTIAEWDCQRHEEKAETGIPDLSAAAHGEDFWIELKQCPIPPLTLNNIRHWTRKQELWLRRRGAHGCGHCYLLVEIGKNPKDATYYLWRWDKLKQVRDMEWLHAAQLAQTFATLGGLVVGLERLARGQPVG